MVEYHRTGLSVDNLKRLLYAYNAFVVNHYSILFSTLSMLIVCFNRTEGYMDSELAKFSSGSSGSNAKEKYKNGDKRVING
jgi:hypothetical protein